MRALEFKSKIKNNRILIPTKIQTELNVKQDKDVRVIVLVDDSDIYDDLIFQEATQSQFLKGYADTDSIYEHRPAKISIYRRNNL
jgi:hypothetical protein